MQDSKKGPHKYAGLKSVNDSYKVYCEDYPKSKVDKKMYIKICLTFFKECLNCLIEGGEVRLPFMGILKIVKRDRNFNKLQPNWKATKELWERDSESKEKKKLVYHLNEHSQGSFYRFFWRKGKVKNLSIYSFLPVRSAKKTLALAIKDDKRDYIG